MKKSRYGAAFIILAALLFLFLVLNICIGSVNIPVSEIPKMLWGNGADETFTDIVMGIRFPRAMAAAILGGGLALSGYLLQTFFHNPIAGPFTLGISSGAKLVVALVMVASLGNALHLSSWVMIMAAFVGSMICMGFGDPDVESDRSDVDADRQRRYDRIYLFCDYRFCGNICGRCRYCQSA